MQALIESLRGLGLARLGAMGAVAAGMLALLAAVALRGGGGAGMALLYGDLDLREAAQITEQLDRAHIPHREEAGGSRVLVPADEVPKARLLLAKEGLPSGGSVGYEIFDRGDGLTATGFQQAINQTRALEGELARSIRTITGVRGARVHLVLPRREPFARERQEAQASVVLTMTGVARLDREGVQAVLNLVAAAVPGLKPANIAVIDARGNLLARAGEPTGPAAAAQSAEELKRATELRLARGVEEMLERTLGPGRVRAEAAVEMDFDHLKEVQERYDPEGKVERSTQSTTDTSKTTEANGTVSVQNNLPNADAGQERAGTSEQRQDETTNYEISKTVRTVVREQPQVKRISLAVLVDGTEAPDPDGKPVWRERTPEELQRIGTLVRSAIGFDEKRGDRVDVVSMRFALPEMPAAEPKAGLLGLRLEKSDVMRLAETGLIGVIALLALLLVLRPMAMRLSTAGIAGVAELTSAAAADVLGGAAALAGPAGAAGGAALGAGPGASGGALPAPGAPGGAVALAAPADERMVEIANVEGQLRASSLRRVSDLVERHPEEALTVVRNWMLQERAG